MIATVPVRDPPRAPPRKPAPRAYWVLTGSEDATALATKFNLDPDLSERLVIPLVNLLDKYGMGESIAESSTARAGAGLIEFVSDIAPVVKGAADFVNNRRKEISAEDREFLDRIKASQDSSGDLSLFIGSSDSIDDIDDDWGEPVETAPPVPQTLEGQISSSIGGNPFTDGVDWSARLEPMAEQQAQKSGGNTIVDIMPERKSIISGIEQLALEAGLDPSDVVSSDTQRKINRGGEHQHGVDYSGGAPAFNLNTDKIAKAMESERKINESKSKVRFDTLPTPDSATDYVPTKGQPAPRHPPPRSPYPPSMTSWPRPASSRSPMAAVPPAVRQSRKPPSRWSPPNGRYSTRNSANPTTWRRSSPTSILPRSADTSTRSSMPSPMPAATG